jgi:hypothetical protein
MAPTAPPTAISSDPPTAAPTSPPELLAIADPVTAGPLPGGLSPRLREVEKDLPAGYADDCHLDFDPERSGECVYGYPDGSSTVVLLGDSHAAQWLPAIEELAFVRDWRVIGLTKSACPPVDARVWLENKKRRYRECDAWRQYALERIASESPTLVFVAGYHLYELMREGERVPLAEDPTAWADALSRTIGAIQATGAQVILVADTPRLGLDPTECLAEHRDAVEACHQAAADVVDAGYAQLERDVAAATGARLLSLTDVICPDGTCPLVFGTTPVYRDDQHLTATFARGLAPTIDRWLDTDDG